MCCFVLILLLYFSELIDMFVKYSAVTNGELFKPTDPSSGRPIVRYPRFVLTTSIFLLSME